MPKKSKPHNLVSTTKLHSWRQCPKGFHWVREHELTIPPSESFPAGGITIRHAHCARNPSGKDQLYPDEIQQITQAHFQNLKILPCPISFGMDDFKPEYDLLIAGWVQYWNEVLDPSEYITPNLVKALIASESGFRSSVLANPKNGNSARGLMQVTNTSRKILGDEKGEIKEHYISVTRDELNDPNINIAAGVRWLFHKHRLLSSRLRREVTWPEVVYEYKGIKKAKTQKDREKIKRIFLDKFEELEKCPK